MTNATEREALKERLVMLRANMDKKSRTVDIIGMQNCPTTSDGWVDFDIRYSRAKIEYEEASRAYDKAFREYVAGENSP